MADVKEIDSHTISDIVFSEVAPLWIREQEKNLAQTTCDRYGTMLELYILPVIGGRKVLDFTSEDADRIVKQIMEENQDRGKRGGGLKGGSLTLIRFIINNMISFAEDADGSKEKFEIPKSEKDSFLALTRQELEKVTWCARHNRCPEMLGVLLMIFMGIRILIWIAGRSGFISLCTG